MKIKHFLGWLYYYPHRLRSGKLFGEYLWHRENLWPTPCQHRKTRIKTANLKTLTIEKECLYCREIITIDCNRPAA